MRISIGKVRLGVRDQERARNFWESKMGCSIATDEKYGDERWLEVALGDTTIILELDEDGPADVPEGQPNTALFLACDDVDATWKELGDNGVSFATDPTDPPWGGTGRWALLEDSEGNRIPLQTKQ